MDTPVRHSHGSPGGRRGGGPALPSVAALLCLAGIPWSSSPAAAQGALRTLIHRGGVTDTLELGRVEELRVDDMGEVWVVTRDPAATEAAGAVWSMDRRGVLRRRDPAALSAPHPVRGPVAAAPTAPGGGPPDVEAVPSSAGPEAGDPLPDAEAAPPFPDTVDLVRARPSGTAARETRFWVPTGAGRFAWIDGPTGRVAYYRGRDGRAVRTTIVVVPETRRSSARGAALGLDRAEAEAAPGDRVVRALADDAGRLWLLLGWSGAREEWAVMDPSHATVVEVMVFPGHFRLEAVRGDRLIGVQRGERTDALHVLVRGES